MPVLFQNAYTSGKESSENLEHLSSGNLRITWVDADGTVLFDNDTDIAGLSNHLDRPEIQRAFENGEGESTRRSDTMNMNTFYYALLLENGTVLRVSTQARTIVSVLITALPVIAGIIVLILLGCVLIGNLLTGQLMKPIEEMAENLDDGNRVPAYRELEPFADKIRSQHENILAAAKSRQDFTANVSHELKTPITAISGYAELIENRLIDSEAEVHVASQIRHNADRLLSLVTDIIQLSELDHRELPRKLEQLDLFSVARECVNEHVLMASQRNIKLICSGTSAGINADRRLVREMIDNLLQNAIRYNKENGTVKLRRDVFNYLKDISDRIKDVSRAEVDKARDVIQIIYDHFDSDEIEEDDILELVDTAKSFYGEINSTQINIAVASTDAVKKGVKQIAKAINDVGLILPEDDVLNILMTFAGDPISTMQPLIDLLKTLDGDVEKLDQRIAVRKSALGVVGENIGTDNQYSSESETIESDLSIVASLR